jgi:hypothetical protein
MESLSWGGSSVPYLLLRVRPCAPSSELQQSVQGSACIAASLGCCASQPVQLQKRASYDTAIMAIIIILD